MIAKRKWKLTAVPVIGFLVTLLMPHVVSDAIYNSLGLCIRVLVPSLLPYMVFSSMFADSVTIPSKNKKSWFCRLLGVSQTGAAAMLIGSVSGYPTGAKTIADLYRAKKLNKQEAEHLLLFVCNAGPGFIFGVIGAFCRSAVVCTAIWAVHLFSSLIIGILFRQKIMPPAGIRNDTEKKLPGFSESFLNAVASATNALLRICGLVCLFSVLTAVEKLIFGAENNILPIIAAFTELSGGIGLLAKSTLPWTWKLILMTASVSFGGLCVMMQTSSVLAGTELSTKHYAAGKLLQAVISGLLIWPVSKVISPTIAASTFPAAKLRFSPLPWMIFSAVIYTVIFLQFPTRNFGQNQV